MLKLIILIFFSTNIYAQSNKYLELSLEECIEIALENNLQLKRSIINERLQKEDNLLFESHNFAVL